MSMQVAHCLIELGRHCQMLSNSSSPKPVSQASLSSQAEAREELNNTYERSRRRSLMFSDCRLSLTSRCPTGVTASTDSDLERIAQLERERIEQQHRAEEERRRAEQERVEKEIRLRELEQARLKQKQLEV